MKYTSLKKVLCGVVATILLASAFATLPLSLPASAEKLPYTTEQTLPVPHHDVAISGPSTGFMQTTDMDVLAMQFVLTADALSVSSNIPSFSNDTGSVTMALFAFETDYDTSLLSSPIAEHTFTDFPDGADLGFVFDKSSPLPAGEYLLVLYDMTDPTPTANGGSEGSGIGVWTGDSHEGQRAYMNGSYLPDMTFPVRVNYVTVPSTLYGVPTRSSVSGNIDYAPHMGAVLDFRLEETKSMLNGGNATKASYVSQDGESFLRLTADKDASDPYQFIKLPDTLIKCNEYKFVLIKMRRSPDSVLKSQLFFTTDEQKLSETASTKPTYADTTDWQYLVVNLGASNAYSGQLKTFRFDYYQSCKGNHYMDIQYIALFKTREAAEAFHDNFEDFQTEIPDNDQNNEDANVKPDYSTYTSADAPADAVAGKLTANGQLGYLYKDHTYVMDFTKAPDEYVAEGAFAFSSIDNAIVHDNRLQCKAFSAYEFYTKKVLGDSYGIRGGTLSFDAVLESGTVTVTLRQIQPNDDYKYSGIRFELKADGTLTVTERDGYTDTVKLDVSLAEEHRIAFADTGDSISLLVDGTAVYTLRWDGVTKTLVTPDGRSFSATHVPDGGYAAYRATRTRGYVDNVTYTYTDIVSKTVMGDHPVDYSTWVATDDLDRTTPTYAQVGAGQDKYVGLFYFMIHSDDTWSRYANDVTRFYLEGGTELVSSKLSSFAGRNGCYWAEPYFGYYSSHDTWVYRKHAYMLDAAGVDFIFLDVSNNKFYVEQCKVLFDTWKSIRDEGGQTPQIAFMYGDMPFTLLNGLYTLLEPFYNNPDYKELLFCWEGKPLLLGNSDTPDQKTWTVSDTTPQTKAKYRELMNKNPELITFFKDEYKTLLSESFTVRKCWAWQAGNYSGYWDWLQESPQALGTDFDGNVEQITVSMGVHAHTGRGRSYVNGDNTYNPNGNFGFTLGTARYGSFFSEQFDYALTQDVDMVMITGWNEWYAGVNVAPSADQTCGQTPTPNYYMIDQMSPEYSRDGEPMKIRDGEGSVGFGDNYYYQMVSYIRKFKGLDAAPATVNGGSLSTADPAEWTLVAPAFTDTVGDTDLRSSLSFAHEFLYTNGTARNDLDVAKVSQDADFLYFHITTATPLITVDDELWMNLYVDADNDPSTGWEGFDYLINRSRTDKTVSVERFVDGRWEFETVGEGEYTLSESAMTVKVGKTALGRQNGETVSLNFKWADNSDVRGDVMRFMELGDTAPNDRFVFAYTASSTEDQRTPAADETPETVIPDSSADTADTTDGKGCRSAVGATAGWTTALTLAALPLIKRKKKEN